MKKIVLSVAAVMFALAAFAQNSAVQSARNYLKENDYDNAIKYINQATEDPSTKDKPKTWNTMGDIYIQMMDDPKYQDRAPWNDAYKAYMKVIELDPAYEKEEVTQKLMKVAYGYHNAAVQASNAKKYDQAIESAENVSKVHRMKRYAGYNKSFDSVAAWSLQLKAYSYYNLDKDDETIAAFNEMKANPILKNVNNYIIPASLYGKQKKFDQQIAVLEEGKKAFPNDANLIREELNYYIVTNKQEELLKKLEDAVAKDPGNADLHYRLANIYNGLALPTKKPGETTDPKPPANSKELIAKAEESYKKAIAAEPNNAEYNFNYGLLFYNQAVQTTMAMNAIEGSDAASMKKYDALKVERDAQFNKALPFIEKANATLDANVKSLNEQDKQIYLNTLRGLQEIYAKLNQQAKSAEMKAKLEANK